MAKANFSYRTETPHGVYTRSSDRVYTHLVIFVAKGRVVYSSYAGSKALAEKASPNYYGKDFTREIYPVGQLKVYKRNGLNCIDMNGTYTYLPDDLSLVNAVEIGGEWYVNTVLVEGEKPKF